jgi:hypothetical protein
VKISALINISIFKSNKYNTKIIEIIYLFKFKFICFNLFLKLWKFISKYVKCVFESFSFKESTLKCYYVTTFQKQFKWVYIFMKKYIDAYIFEKQINEFLIFSFEQNINKTLNF